MKSGKLTSVQQKRIQEAHGNVAFARLLGIELEAVDTGVATLSLQVTNDLKQNTGVVHGGVIASLIDTATAFAIMTILSDDERTTTVDLTISYLRPLLEGRARAIAKVIRNGRRLVVASAEVMDNAGTILATALTTYIKIQ